MFPILGLYADVRFHRHKTIVALTIAHMLLSATALLLRWLDIIYDGSSNQFEIIVIVSTILQFINDPVSILFKSSSLSLD